MKKALRTKICDILGIEYPILCAGMHGPGGPPIAGPELVAAVGNAGGMGFIAAGNLEPEELREWIRKVRNLSDMPFGVDIPSPAGLPHLEETPAQIKAKGLAEYPEHEALIEKLRQEYGIPKLGIPQDRLFTPDLGDDQLDVVIEEKVPFVAFALGTQERAAARAHAAGLKVIALVGSVKHARRTVERGADILVAQGGESGGHAGRIGTFALVPQVVDAVHPVPVLAAGGIADGRGLVAALALGAEGVWLGTRFEATFEATQIDAVKQRIIEARDEDAAVSKYWSGKTTRQERHPFEDAWEKAGLPALQPPLQYYLIHDITEAIYRSEKWGLRPLLMGQIAGMIKEIKSAKQVIDDMVDEAINILKERFVSEVTINE